MTQLQSMSDHRERMGESLMLLPDGQDSCAEVGWRARRPASLWRGGLLHWLLF